MTSIHLDDDIAKGLNQLAASEGMTVEEYLQLLVTRANGTVPGPVSCEDFDAQLNQLVFDGPSLPSDFSRSDIYADHD